MKIRLKEWREKKGLSVRGLAEKCDLNFSTIHRIEMGKTSPTVSVLEKIAKVLEIHITDLFPSKKQK